METSGSNKSYNTIVYLKQSTKDFPDCAVRGRRLVASRESFVIMSVSFGDSYKYLWIPVTNIVYMEEV